MEPSQRREAHSAAANLAGSIENSQVLYQARRAAAHGDTVILRSRFSAVVTGLRAFETER